MPKFILKSKGFVATALGILVYVGSEVFGVEPKAVSDVVVEIVTIVLLLIGLYGRYVARQPLSMNPKDTGE